MILKTKNTKKYDFWGVPPGFLVFRLRIGTFVALRLVIFGCLYIPEFCLAKIPRFPNLREPLRRTWLTNPSPETSFFCRQLQKFWYAFFRLRVWVLLCLLQACIAYSACFRLSSLVGLPRPPPSPHLHLPRFGFLQAEAFPHGILTAFVFCLCRLKLLSFYFGWGAFDLSFTQGSGRCLAYSPCCEYRQPLLAL